MFYAGEHCYNEAGLDWRDFLLLVVGLGVIGTGIYACDFTTAAFFSLSLSLSHTHTHTHNFNAFPPFPPRLHSALKRDSEYCQVALPIFALDLT